MIENWDLDLLVRVTFAYLVFQRVAITSSEIVLIQLQIVQIPKLTGKSQAPVSLCFYCSGAAFVSALVSRLS